MVYTVTITSQGQISIPIALRRQLGLDRSKRATVQTGEDGTIVIKPVVDLLDLYGAIKTKKKISSKKIREDFEMYLAKRHLRKS